MAFSLGIVLGWIPSVCQAGILTDTEWNCPDASHSSVWCAASPCNGGSCGAAESVPLEDFGRQAPAEPGPIQVQNAVRFDGLFSGGGSCSSTGGADSVGGSGNAYAATNSKVLVPELSCSGRLIMAAITPLLAPPPWEMLDPPKVRYSLAYTELFCQM